MVFTAKSGHAYIPKGNFPKTISEGQSLISFWLEDINTKEVVAGTKKIKKTKKTKNQGANYGSIKKGMNASDISKRFGSPVQKHSAPTKVFGIEVINGIELWEYHAGGNYIKAIWLVKLENDKVTDLGRSQGAMLSNIKFGYLNK